MPRCARVGVTRAVVRVALPLAVLAATVSGVPRVARGQTVNPGSIEIVLQASDGARQRMGTGDRLAVARAFVGVLREALGRDGAHVAVSLRVYGGASEPRVQACQAPDRRIREDAAPEEWTALFDALRPQGSARLALALERAARDTVGTYVLLSDGTDECDARPCATWRQVVGERGNRRARLHVVGLDPEPDAVETLRCLSRAGSGSLTILRGAEEAGPAARRLALVLRNEGLLDVRLTVGADGERIVAPVRVQRPLSREVVASFTSRQPRPVPAGMYTVVAETPPSRAFHRVMILPGDTTVVADSSFGRLVVDLRDPEGQPLRAPVSVGARGRGPELRYVSTGEPVILGSGRYDVRIDVGDSLIVRHDAGVVAGRTTTLRIGGGDGTLTVVAPEFDAPPPTAALLYRADRVDTLRVGESSPLPAGRYRLVVRTIPIFVSENVTVESDRATTVELPETGILGVSLVGPAGPLEGIQIDVREPLTGEIYGTLKSGEPRLAMPGRYQLELRTIPAQTIDDVAVEAGARRIVERRGVSRIEVDAGPDAAAVRLEVFNASGGRRLGEASGAPPAIAAWPGSYLARVWRGAELVWQGPVTVASDKTARIDLKTP